MIANVLPMSAAILQVTIHIQISRAKHRTDWTILFVFSRQQSLQLHLMECKWPTSLWYRESHKYLDNDAFFCCLCTPQQWIWNKGDQNVLYYRTYKTLNKVSIITFPVLWLPSQLLANAVLFLCVNCVGIFHLWMTERDLRISNQKREEYSAIRSKKEIKKYQQVKQQLQINSVAFHLNSE